jgi:hypothetical protein
MYIRDASDPFRSSRTGRAGNRFAVAYLVGDQCARLHSSADRERSHGVSHNEEIKLIRDDLSSEVPLQPIMKIARTLRTITKPSAIDESTDTIQKIKLLFGSATYSFPCGANENERDDPEMSVRVQAHFAWHFSGASAAVLPKSIKYLIPTNIGLPLPFKSG